MTDVWVARVVALSWCTVATLGAGFTVCLALCVARREGLLAAGQRRVGSAAISW